MQSIRGTGRASGKVLICASQLIRGELTVYKGIQDGVG
jgi:hypothetical protein